MKMLALISIILLAPQYAIADDLPHPKSGLWELRTIREGTPPSITKMCTDEHTQDQMMQMGSDMSARMGNKCAKPEIKKTSAGYESNSECEMMGSKMNSHATFSGDFDKEYRGEVNATFNPPFLGRSASKTVIEAKYLGNCELGQKPGDMILPGGQVINMSTLGKLPPNLGNMLKNPK